MKGMNRDLAAKIRAHLDEMAALLDREERADEQDSIAAPKLPPAIEQDAAETPSQQDIKVEQE